MYNRIIKIMVHMAMPINPVVNDEMRENQYHTSTVYYKVTGMGDSYNL